jgi:flagellar hook-associated protein 1 FlgK
MLSVNLPGGLPLVQGNQAMTISTVTNGSDVNLQLEISGTKVDLTLDNLGGQFKGMFAMRDVFIADLRTNLDTLAIDLTSSVNNVHSGGYAPVIDPATGLPTTGLNFFKDIAGPPVTLNASRHVELFITGTSQIAAAGNPEAAPGDNETALAIGQLEVTHKVGGTNDTFDNFFSQMVATVGIEAARNKLALGGAEDAATQLQNLRDGFSGVSLEEEMIDLIQYQRGFESSAKFLATVDEMMTSLLQLKA